MNNDRIQLPGLGMPQQSVMQIAAPFNDVQLVALMAAQSTIVDPVKAVAKAVEIVAEAILQAGGGKIGEAVQRRKALSE